MCAWTFTSTAPFATDRDYVRLRIGDTSSGDQLLQDEHITGAISEWVNRDLAAAACAEMVGAYYARKVDKTAGKLSISMSQASEHYFGLAKRLRMEVALGAKPYAGGISVSDKESEESDSDRVAPAFSVGIFDHGAASSSGWD